MLNQYHYSGCINWITLQNSDSSWGTNSQRNESYTSGKFGSTLFSSSLNWVACSFLRAFLSCLARCRRSCFLSEFPFLRSSFRFLRSPPPARRLPPPRFLPLLPALSPFLFLFSSFFRPFFLPSPLFLPPLPLAVLRMAPLCWSGVNKDGSLQSSPSNILAALRRAWVRI